MFESINKPRSPRGLFFVEKKAGKIIISYIQESSGFESLKDEESNVIYTIQNNDKNFEDFINRLFSLNYESLIGARKFGILWRPVASCGGGWQPIGCPIDNRLQPGGLENRSCSLEAWRIDDSMHRVGGLGFDASSLKVCLDTLRLKVWVS